VECRRRGGREGGSSRHHHAASGLAGPGIISRACSRLCGACGVGESGCEGVVGWAGVCRKTSMLRN
jgi:hypothetical protein